MKTTYNKSEILKEAWRLFNITTTNSKMDYVYYRRNEMTPTEWNELIEKNDYSKKSIRQGCVADMIYVKTEVRANGTFSNCLKRAWREAKLNVDINVYELASITNGNVWNNRVYFNGNFGAVYFDAETKEMGIKTSDMTPFNSQMLNSFLNEKANQIQNLGINLR